MTQVTRISHLHIRNYGIFRNFIWKPDLEKFNRYNLIYGWNGTGKTILSRIFRNLENREQPKTGEVTLHIGDNDIKGEEFPQSNFQIRVFNRDFIKQNVFPTESGMQHIFFVLGEESVRKQKEVEGLQKQLATARSQLALDEKAFRKSDKTFEQFCINQAKLIKDTLRLTGQTSNQNPYNNYDKSDFQNNATNMLVFGGGSSHLLTDTEHEKLLSQYRETVKDEVKELDYAIPDLKSITGRVSKLLHKTAVSAAIDALKNDTELADWILQGLRLHEDRNTKQCQFCKQLLPERRLAALHDHFNDQYEHLTTEIDSEIGKLNETKNQLEEFVSKVKLMDEEKLYSEYHDRFRTTKTQLTDGLQRLKEFLDDATKVLKDKKSKFFESTKLDIDAPPVKVGAVENLNAVIQGHNRVSNNFQTRLNTVRKQLADSMVAKDLTGDGESDNFVKLRDTKDAVQKALEKRNKRIDHLEAEIKNLEHEIRGHRRPAEELNEDLQKYLGHGELRVEIKETGYAITRGREPAGSMSDDSLSEGETTAIALLYFLKSLQDKNFELKDGIVVLDDPVSSLDANALFLAFSFIHERTKNAGQLFVLTHNFSFFRQVRSWFHYEKHHAGFFMLEPSSEDSVRSSTIRLLDPLLKNYESEYHYLFSRVYQASNSSASQSLEKNYILPNIARRVLETFLAFRLPADTPLIRLKEKLDKVEFDEVKKRRISRFLHTHSHSTVVGEQEHDLTELAEASGVLNDLLEMIRSEDGKHYSAMVQLCESQGETG